MHFNIRLVKMLLLCAARTLKWTLTLIQFNDLEQSQEPIVIGLIFIQWLICAYFITRFINQTVTFYGITSNGDKLRFNVSKMSKKS